GRHGSRARALELRVGRRRQAPARSPRRRFRQVHRTLGERERTLADGAGYLEFGRRAADGSRGAQHQEVRAYRLIVLSSKGRLVSVESVIVMFPRAVTV